MNIGKFLIFELIFIILNIFLFYYFKYFSCLSLSLSLSFHDLIPTNLQRSIRSSQEKICLYRISHFYLFVNYIALQCFCLSAKKIRGKISRKFHQFLLNSQGEGVFKFDIKFIYIVLKILMKCLRWKVSLFFLDNIEF